MSSTVIVRRVRLRNILSHENTDIVFPMGLIALVGPNGAGKSSIVDSIVYAMFVSPKSGRSFRGEGKKGILRIGTSEGSIELELSVSGKIYRIQRIISVSRPETAKISEVDENGNERVIAVGVDNVLDVIRSILGIPSSDAIRLTVVSRQNELSRLIEEQPSRRKELILRLLGLEELEKAKDLLKQALDGAERARIRFDEIRRMINDITNELSRLEKEVSEKRERLDRLNLEINSLRERLSYLEKLRDLGYRYDKLKNIVAIYKEIKELEKYEDYCRTILGIKRDEVISIYRAIAEDKQEREKLREKLTKINSEIDKLKSELSNIVRENIDGENIDRILEVIDHHVERLLKEKMVKEAELKLNRDSINIIRESTVCPLCGRELSLDLREKLSRDIDLRIEFLEKSLEEYNSIITKLKNLYERFRSLAKSRYELDGQLDQITRRLSNNIQKFKEIQEDLDNILSSVKGVDVFSTCFSSSIISTITCLQNKAKEIQDSLNEKRNLLHKLLKDVNADINTILEEFNNIVKELAGYGVNLDSFRYSEIENEYRKISDELNRKISESERIRGFIESSEARKKELNEKIKNLDEELKELEKLVKIYPSLDILVNRILGKDGLLAKLLTNEARMLIERYTNRILHELGMDFSITIDEDFNISVKTMFGDIDVRGLSGGEQVALSIALRIALAYTVFGRLPGFFILDEPTQFLDSERRRTIFEIIKRLSERLPQVLVVTHDVEVVDMADKVYYISKEGGRSVVRERIEYIAEIT
ncbi:SMC domain protein [Ignisphaera aggregans DSM 17230]|uniref:SMC domain protein n=1 Tax=Ignisphaera aggregans (strain DSM 17230 / JCM 13409 / AQ1.S1) TaxID=583356 RepID=E0SP05_IGNAA|nr:SMC domain protein [Ignisphaera aggregans DSM 17230]